MSKTIALISVLSAYTCTVLSGTDPMRPPDLQQPAKRVQRVMDSSHWHLNLIRRAGDGRVALLNGKLIGVGDVVDGARVTEIGTHQVTLSLPDERSLRLALPSAQLKNGRD